MVGNPGRREGEVRPAPQDVSRQELDPFAECLFTALTDERPSLTVDDLGRAVRLASCNVVTDRITGHVVVGEPVGRATVAISR